MPKEFCQKDLGWTHAPHRRFRWPAQFWLQGMLPALHEEDRARYKGYTIEFCLPLHAPAPKMQEDGTLTDDRKNLESYFLNLQLDLMRGLIPRFYQHGAALRNIVGNIMGRNMSHNIGSHVLARYAAEESSDALFKTLNDIDGKNPELLPLIPRVEPKATPDMVRREAMRYLQSRMDFIAESSTTESAFEQPLYLFRDVISEFNGQSLLRYFISGKNDLPSEISHFNDAHCNEEKEASSKDLRFSCPGGAVGAHAFFVIVENIIRNCARHSTPENRVEISICAKESVDDEELIEITAIDNGPYSNESKYEKIDELGRISSTPDRVELVEHINQIIRFVPFLNSDNSPNSSYWGLREMQICATYLRGVPLEDIESYRSRSDKTSVLSAFVKGGRLGYRFFLRKARVCAIVVDDAFASIVDKFEDRTKALQPFGIALFRESDISRHDARVRNERSSSDEPLRGYINAVRTKACEIKPSVYWPIRSLSCKESEMLSEAVDSLLSQELDSGAPINLISSGTFELALAAAWSKNILNEGAVAIELTDTAGKLEDDPFPDPSDPFGNPREETMSIAGLRVYSKVPYKWQPGYTGSSENSVLDSAPFIGNKGLFVWLSHLTALPSAAQLSQLAGLEPLFSELPQARLWSALDVGNEKRTGTNILELTAALAAGVVVFDERIQSQYYGHYKKLCLGNLWELFNVFVPSPNSKTAGTGSCDLNHPKLEALKQFIDETQNKHPHFNAPPKLQYLVIHQTILDALYAKDRTAVDTWLDGLTLNLIVCSGRGTPRGHDKFPKGARFIAYSNIAKQLIHQPSKFGLVTSLDASRHPHF